MMDVSQIILPHTLKLYSAVYQSYLNKTGRKQEEKGNVDPDTQGGRQGKDGAEAGTVPPQALVHPGRRLSTEAGRET